MFLQKSIFLFKNELTNFINSFGENLKLDELIELKMRIHKIKPSCELFDLPKEILFVLNETYFFNFDQKEDQVKILSNLKLLLIFFEKLRTEIDKYLTR